MDHSDNPEIWRAAMEAQISLHDKREDAKRRADVGALPSDQYAAIEDIVLLQAIDDLLKRVWHKDDERGHYRKGRQHLGALAFHLREDLRKNL